MTDFFADFGFFGLKLINAVHRHHWYVYNLTFSFIFLHAGIRIRVDLFRQGGWCKDSLCSVWWAQTNVDMCENGSGDGVCVYVRLSSLTLMSYFPSFCLLVCIFPHVIMGNKNLNWVLQLCWLLQKERHPMNGMHKTCIATSHIASPSTQYRPPIAIHEMYVDMDEYMDRRTRRNCHNRFHHCPYTSFFSQHPPSPSIYI